MPKTPALAPRTAPPRRHSAPGKLDAPKTSSPTPAAPKAQPKISDRSEARPTFDRVGSEGLPSVATASTEPPAKNKHSAFNALLTHLSKEDNAAKALTTGAKVAEGAAQVAELERRGESAFALGNLFKGGLGDGGNGVLEFLGSRSFQSFLGNAATALASGAGLLLGARDPQTIGLLSSSLAKMVLTPSDEGTRATNGGIGAVQNVLGDSVGLFAASMAQKRLAAS